MTAKMMSRLSNTLFVLAIVSAIVLGALYLADVLPANGAYPVGMTLALIAFVVDVLAEIKAKSEEQR